MRFSTIILSALAGSATLVAALPRTFSEQELYVRSEGDVSVFEGREITSEEIIARDAAYAAAMGGDSLEVRDIMPEDELHDLAMRQLEDELDGRDITELEPRAVAQVARVVAKGIEAIVKVIKGRIEHDKAERGKFTSHFIGESMKKYPQWNWVICHTRHTTKFEGQKGKDWGHRHQEFPVSFGKTIGYEIYWFKKGTFERHGDGGYLNWAFGGRVKSRTNNGATVTFN